MFAAEAAVMEKHQAYWRGLMDRGPAVAFGPVADPKGPYGLGIAQLDDDADPQALGQSDPAIQSGLGFRFEVHPMPRLVLPTTYP